VGEGSREDGDRAGIRRRLTVPEAAAELGTTSEGVRSRIKRGTLETERESGRVWVILKVAPPRQDAAPPRSDAAPTEGRAGDRAELVEEMRDRIASLERELERRADEAGELRRIIAALTSRIPEIEPPRESPSQADARLTPSESASNTETPPEAERVPWWRRVFGG
jgi:hypothetical protein